MPGVDALKKRYSPHDADSTISGFALRLVHAPRQRLPVRRRPKSLKQVDLSSISPDENTRFVAFHTFQNPCGGPFWRRGRQSLESRNRFLAQIFWRIGAKPRMPGYVGANESGMHTGNKDGRAFQLVTQSFCKSAHRELARRISALSRGRNQAKHT